MFILHPSIEAEAQSRDHFGLEVYFRLLSCSNVLRNHGIKVYKTYHSHGSSKVGDHFAFLLGCKISRAARKPHDARLHTYEGAALLSQIVHENQNIHHYAYIMAFLQCSIIS